MKKTISPFVQVFCLVLVVCLMAFGLILPAQLFAQSGLGNPGTISATVNGTATSTGAGTIPLSQSKSVSVQLTTVSSAANTSNTVVSFDQRVGSGAWVSTGKTMTIANTGTTSASCVSNWVDLADAEWRVNVQNGAVSGVTNTVTIGYHLKP
jgi:hypothetical protein